MDVSENVSEETNAESEETKIPEDDQPAAPRMLSLSLAAPDGPMLMTVSSDSLQAKIAAAEDNDTVIMDRDYTENIIFPMNKTVTLDLGGYTLRPDTSASGATIVNTVTVFGTAVIVHGIVSGRVESGSAALNARGAFVPNGGKLILGEGAVVCGFTVKGSGGGIHVDGDGVLELAGGTVKDNSATESGGGIFIYDAAKLSAKNGTVISGNQAAYGGGIAAYRMYTYGSTITGLTLENNTAENGGGMYIGGIVDLTPEMPFGNITFRGNQAENGGGLYCGDQVTADLTNLRFENNTATSYGGAGYFKRAVNANIRSSSVLNSQSNSGALYFAAASTVNFDGTTLSGNQSTSHGGALYAAGALQMELNNVTISDNTAGLGGTGDTYGGAFYLSAQKNQVTLLSGTISGNIAKPRQSENSSSYGGAFYFNTNSVFTMKGGIFDGNTVNQRGGAVYLGGGATVEIAGGTFRNNKAGWGGALYMSGKLNISDVLAEKNTGTAIANNGSTTISGGIFRENTSGYYSITAVTAWDGTLTVTGGTFTKNSGIAVGNSGGTVTISGGEICENTGSGAGNRYGTIYIQEGANIHDNAQWGVYNSNEGSKVVMTGGSLRNNKSGGIFAYGVVMQTNNFYKSRVTVSGGEIRDNGGRGVHCGIAEISGGVICGNVGGVYATDVTVSGGEITGNQGADNGGGIYVYKGNRGGTDPNYTYFRSHLSVTGGVIKDNRANKLGNDIYVEAPFDGNYSSTSVSIATAQAMTGEKEGAAWLDEVSRKSLTEVISARRHTEENGVEAYTFKSISNPVAQIGETVYPSLQSAFDAIQAGTATDTTVLLLKDDTENVTIPAGVTAVLDLQGHSVFTNSGTILTVGQAPAEAVEGEEAPADPAPASLTVKDSVVGGELTGATTGAVVVNSGKLTGATTGAVVVNSGSSFTMRDISIEKNYNTTTAGGGVILRSGSTMTMNSGSVSGNRGVGGSGIYVEKGAALTINGGAISGNRTVASADGAANSGAIKALGRVIMYGGEITGNEISRHWQLPAVYLTGDGAYFELNNGTISGNLRGYQTSRWNSYGPVGVVQGAQMVMNGGRIENNTDATNLGDGASAVRVYNDASAQCTSFTMNGGVIQGNTGTSGAVYVNSRNTNCPTAFIMTGGEISGNENTSGNYGGGVRASGYFGELRLTGGKITGNTSRSGGGGGVYIGASGSNEATINGTQIYGNTSGNDLGNDVYIDKSSKVLAFQNAAAYTGLPDGLSYNCWHDDLNGVDYTQTDFEELCKALGWTKSGDYYMSKATALTAANVILPPADSEDAVAYYVPMSYGEGGQPVEVTPEQYVYFDSLADAMQAMNGGLTKEDGTLVKVPTGAVIHLKADFAETVLVPAVAFTLNLNGHTLTTAKANATIFTLKSGADMTLTDTAGPIAHKSATGALTLHESYATGRGFDVQAGASLTIAGGQLTGFTMANQPGPAINCAGNLTITGGSVTDNAYTGKAESGVIRVNNKDSVVSITGGTFTGNAGYIGGVVSIEAAKSMLVQDVAFENNQAAVNGGAIVVRSCPELTLKNVTFRGNHAGTNGGGLCTYDNYTNDLLLEGCSFAENTATTGGGASLGRYTKVTITGGSFTDNHAGGEGGGIWARNLSLTACTFTGNTSVGSGGAVRHAADGNRPEDVLTVEQCQFSDNKAGDETHTDRSGGAIYSTGAGMELKNTTFQKNQATSYGGAVYRSSNSTGCTSTVEKCTFVENAATYGGALCVSTLANVKDSEFEKNRAKSYGGALYISAQTNVENAEFVDNRASYGGAIYVSYTSADIHGCKLHKNEATQGGAIYQTTNNASHYVTLYQGTEIYENTANYGGGCYGTRTRLKENAKIYQNTAKYYGGGVYGTVELNNSAEIYKNQTVYNDGGGIQGNTTMNGGSIHDNTAGRHGGGIYTSGSVTVNSGEIYSNTAKSDGGGVCTRGLTMNGGTIRDNTAGRYGGGVGHEAYLWSFKMYGGKIRDNYAGNSGGGVYAATNDAWSTVAHQWLVGGSITGNTAARNGGGAVLGQNVATGETRIYGDIVITDNHAGNYGGGIYYYYASQQEQNFGLYTGDPDHSGKPALYGNTAALGQDYYIVANAKPNICRAVEMNLPESLHVLGWLDESNNTLIDTEIHGKNPRYWALTLAYTDDQFVAAVGDELFATVGKAVEYIQQHPDGNHEIVMVADSRENVTVPAGVDVTLNLNGHTLHGFSTAVTLNGTLTLVDEENHNYDDRPLAYKIGAGPAGQGTITGSAATYGGGFVVRSGGELIINSGNLSECYASSGGAAIYVDGGKATMNGGKISGNLGYNGAIYVNQTRSTFILNGGEICDNVNRSQSIYYYLGSGTLFNNGGNLMILGGEIHHNLGRNVVYSTGKTTITGGRFTNNLAGDSTNNQWGSGVVHVNGGTTNIGGTGANPVVISENTANGEGGAIYLESGEMYLSHTDLKNNKATTYGGAIYQIGGNLVVTSGTEISGNSAGNKGGAFYQESGTAQILSGTITNNRAPVGGGIAQTATPTQNRAIANCSVFDGVKLYENVSTVSNTGNDVYSAYEGTGNWETIQKKSSMTLEAVVNMQHPKYNVWRDDVYTGNNYAVAELLGDGMYITDFIDRSNNLQLTVYHYEINETLVPLANNRKISELKFAPADASDLAFISGTYESSAERITTAEQTASQTNLTASAETYQSSSGETLHYLTKDGQLYEQSQMVQWTPGEDASRSSTLVLSNDTVTYSLAASFVATGADGTEEENTEKVRTWMEVELDADSNQASIQIPNNFRGYILSEVRDGKQVQVMRCYKEETVGQNDIRNYTLSINVLSMKNGETLKPRIRMWVEGNEENENTPPTVFGDRLTVSATGKYNVTLKQNSKLAYTGYFDTTTGKETSAPEAGTQNSNVIYGTMLGYGITVMMHNADADGTVPPGKGMKGLEIPADGLEMELHVKGGLYLDGNALNLGSGSNSVIPVFWALKENEKSDYGIGEGQSAPTFNMNWDDEDEKIICTNYAYNAAPFNSGSGDSSCYNGGSWMLTRITQGTDESVLHLKVSGYTFDMSNAYPNKNSDGMASDQFNNNYTKPFTAGYLQMIFPFPDKVMETANGYLSVDMQAAVSDVQIVTASGQKPVKGTDPSTLKAYYGENEAASHATGEVRFEDNRIASSNGLYVYNGYADSENANIFVTNYWLTGDRGTIAGERGDGTIPLGNQVYMGGQLFYSSKAIRTDEEYLDEQPNPYYIPDSEFNPQTDNKTEFFYATAINMLQKFDADAYKPLPSTPVVDQRISGTYNQNNLFVTTSETSTNWKYPNLTTSMNLTVLYAAKPDGTNWNKVNTTAQQMLNEGKATQRGDGLILYKGQLYRPNQAVYSDGGVGEMDQYHEGQLLYFETMDDLHAYLGKDAKCVAILYQARDCCIRTGRDIRFEHKMQITNDFNYTGQTYCTTNDSRIWITYRPDYKTVRDDNTKRVNFLYDFNWDDVAYQGEVNAVAKGLGSEPGTFDPDVDEKTGYKPKVIMVERRRLSVVDTGETDDNGNLIQVSHWDTVSVPLTIRQSAKQISSGYIKTEYEYGCQKAGTHNGYRLGNTLLLYTLLSEIQINGADRLNDNSNAVKKQYNLSQGERIVNYKVNPTLTKSSAISNALVENGSQAVQVSIDLTLPKGISYREGSIAFDYTPDQIYGKEVPTFKEGELEWVISPTEKNTDGTSIIRLTTYVSDVSKNLPKVTFSGFIGAEGDNDVQSGEVLTTKATIYASYEEQNQLAAIAKSDSFDITVEKDGNVGIYMDALPIDSADQSGTNYSLLTEVGEDFGYELVYYNNDQTSASSISLADVLPYNKDDRGTAFDGGYRIKQIQVVFTGSGAAESASSYEDKGNLFIVPGIKAGSSQPTENQQSWEALFGSNPPDGASAVQKPQKKTDIENTQYTFTYDLYDLPEYRTYDTDKLGKLLYVSLGDVAGKTNVHVKVTLSAATREGEETVLIKGAEGKTQQGGNKYFNDFAAMSGGSLMNSLKVDVTVVQRSITGYAFMDMNKDGRYTLGNTADAFLKNIRVELTTVNEQNERVSATDVMGNPIAPVLTDQNGRYTFNNVAPGNYMIVFTDLEKQYVWKEGQPNFNELAVSILPGADSGYYQTAADVNRCVATYSDAADINGLVEAHIYSPIAMPKKGQMKTATVISANNNAGFYCIEAKLVKNWTGMVTAVPKNTVLTYHLQGTVGSDNLVTAYKEDFRITQGASYNQISAVKSDQSTAPATVTMPPKTVPATYIWEVGPFYLRAKDSAGTDIAYDFTEELNADFDTTGYDEPQLVVKLDAMTGQTIFEATNHRRTHEFAFMKVDAKGVDVENKVYPTKGLAGAKFQFKLGDTVLKFTKNPDGSYRVSCDNLDVDNKGNLSGTDQIEVDGSGRLKLTGLPEGKLIMTETKAPRGYVRPGGSWTVTVGESGINKDSFGTEAFSATPKMPALAVKETVSTSTDAHGKPITTTSYEYFFTNVQHKQIPITGADGIGGYLIVGLTFMTAGALLLLEYRRRKRANGAV